MQIRGSVPIFWGEVNTLRYKPDLQIMDLQETVGAPQSFTTMIFMFMQADAMRKHLQEQVSTYGEQILVNLVNQKGYERPVKDAYERYLAEVSSPNHPHDDDVVISDLQQSLVYPTCDTNTLISTTSVGRCVGVESRCSLTR